MKEETGCVPTPILTFKIRSQHLFSQADFPCYYVASSNVQHSASSSALCCSWWREITEKTIGKCIVSKAEHTYFLALFCYLSLEVFFSLVYTYFGVEVVAACAAVNGAEDCHQITMNSKGYNLRKGGRVRAIPLYGQYLSYQTESQVKQKQTKL